MVLTLFSKQWVNFESSDLIQESDGGLHSGGAGVLAEHPASICNLGQFRILYRLFSC